MALEIFTHRASWHVGFRLMMSAIVTAAVGVRMLRLFRVRALIDSRPVAWSAQPVQSRHVLGSVIFGVGWAVTGTCPGPVAVQLGRGQLAAVFTISGLLAGIALRDWLAALRKSTGDHAFRPRRQESVAAAGL